MTYITHVPCGTPVTLRRRVPQYAHFADYEVVTYCTVCNRDVPISELSSPGPYSAVLPEEERG